MKKILKHSIKSFECIMLALIVALTGIHMPMNKSTVTVTKAASPVVESAISWAISIANNNSHGYSQISRWGPDYDCSSFVISAFKSAGVNVGSATYTGNMRSQFILHGFQWIPWSQIGSVSNLQRGDILLNESTHTELYLGNNQNVGAHSNRGYPQTGDQTGTEVSVSGYYYHPWDGVLRYVGGAVCSCSTSYAGDYTVTTSSLPLTMRSGHGTGYSAITSIPKGSQVYVSKANGSWAHVEWNGYSGYCSMSYLSKITSTSYNLHVWISDSKMGDVPTNFNKGNRYYLCYELTEASTEKKANEISSMNYNATETIHNSTGKVFEYTYEKSDYNWISIVCDSEDTYTGTVTITGDVGITCTVSFDVYADTAPQFNSWAWDSNESQEISTAEFGKTVYCSYLIRDKYTTYNLNDVTKYWTQGNGYTVTIAVYDPSGSVIKNQSFKNNDSTKISFVPNKIGNYRIKTTVSGNLSGSQERTIKVEEEEHNYSSWTIIQEPTCTEYGTKTRTCSICNSKEYLSVSKISHTYDNGTISKQATCEENGTKTYSCTMCGKTKSETIQKTGHNVVIDEAVEPTYTHGGLTEGSHCSKCRKILVAQEDIPQIEYIPEVTPSPTPTVAPTPTLAPTPKPLPEETATPITPPMEEEMIIPTIPPTEEETIIPTIPPAKEEMVIPTIPSDTTENSGTTNSSNDTYVPTAGTLLVDQENGVIYEVIEPGKSVSINSILNKKIKNYVILDTITFWGITYQVTQISNNAFRGCKRLKKVTIGRYVTQIGSKAFYGCKKLKRITINSKQIKKSTVGKKAFKGMSKKSVIKVPKKLKKKYKKWLKEKGNFNGKVV